MGLQKYEIMFKYRYTEEDEDFMKTVTHPLPPPPFVENWYSRPKRNFDYTRNQQRGSHHQNYRGRGGYDNRHGGYNRDDRQGHGHRQSHGHRQGHGYGHQGQ